LGPVRSSRCQQDFTGFLLQQWAHILREGRPAGACDIQLDTTLETTALTGRITRNVQMLCLRHNETRRKSNATKLGSNVFFFAKCHPHVTTWAVLIELAVDHKGLKETAGLLHKKVIEHQEDRLTSQQFGWTVS
jgi:hypothetical protein